MERAGGAAVPGYHTAGAVAGLAGNFAPSITGPGLIWKAMQRPETQKMLEYAAKLPANSKELQLIANDIYKVIVPATQKIEQESK